VAPAGAAVGAPASRSFTPRDPRDGQAPPMPRGPSPASPLAVAQLFSGDPTLSVDRVAQVLGATTDALIANRNSILYQPAVIVTQAARDASAKATGALAPAPAKGKRTKAAGSPSSAARARMVVSLGQSAPAVDTTGGLVRVVAPRGPSPATPAPESADDATADGHASDAARMAPVSSSVQRYIDWLTLRGVDNGVWRANNFDQRLALIQWIFFDGPNPARTIGVNGLGATPPPPGATPGERPTPLATPEAMRDVVDRYYGLTTMTELGQRWRQELEAAGIPCQTWAAAGGDIRTLSSWVTSLAYSGRLSVRGFGLDTINNAVRAACVGANSTGDASPAANELARLGSLGECPEWMSLDKMQQMERLQRAYPELRNDTYYSNPFNLLRVALAKYESCVPPSEPGWNGETHWDLPTAERPTWNEASDSNNITSVTTLGRARTSVQWVKQGGYMPPTGPDLFDCVQGATGDCYLIAALASLVWTMPDFVAGMGTPVGPDRRRYRIAGQSVDVSERVPTLIMAQYAALFARNNRTDAKWPGVVEKAYAAFRSRDTTDRPDVRMASNWTTTDSTPGARIDVANLASTFGPRGGAGGMPLIDFTGRDPFWYLTFFRSDDEIWRLILEHCDARGRALDPMVAGSYGPGGFIDGTDIVPMHAFSILGAGASADGRKFVVMRNPWGFHIPRSPYLVPLPSRWLGQLNVNSGESGCFALAHGAFSAGFVGFYGVPGATEFRNV